MSTYETESGKKPPPVAQRFKRGQSGNLRGRPKGAISKKVLTKKVALTRIPRDVNGKKHYITVLGAVTLTLRTMAMEGHAGAAAIIDDLVARMQPPAPENGGGFLVVPETLTDEECMAQMERHNAAHPHEPGTPEYEKFGR